MLGLARSLIKPALGALASAGLSFGAEKVLKKKEIELYKLAQRMTPAQTKEVERYLVGQGVVREGAEPAVSQKFEHLSKQGLALFNVSCTASLCYLLHKPVEDLAGGIVDRSIYSRDHRPVIDIPA